MNEGHDLCPQGAHHLQTHPSNALRAIRAMKREEQGTLDIKGRGASWWGKGQKIL